MGGAFTMLRTIPLFVLTVFFAVAELVRPNAENTRIAMAQLGTSRLTPPPSGSWVSDSGHGVCTLRVTLLRNEFLSHLKRAARTEEFSATLKIEMKKTDSNASVREIGFFWDRAKGSVVMNFDDVHSYNFTGSLNERGDTISGVWSPMIACGREFKKVTRVEGSQH
jgi:hypothetical protein